MVLGAVVGLALLAKHDNDSAKKLATSSSSSTTTSAASEEVRFTDPDGHFTVSFPTAPKRTDQPNSDATKPPTVSWQSGLVNQNLVVARTALAPGEVFIPQGAAEDSASAVDGKLISVNESVDAAGNTTVDFVIDRGGRGTFYSYAVSDGTQVFFLQAIVAAGDSTGPELLARLKASFSIVG